MKSNRLKLTQYEPSEAQVLSSILEILNIEKYRGNVIWYSRMNSGVAYFGEDNRRRRVAFGFKGAPDIIGMLPGGVGLYLEVKRPTGRPTEDQKRFIGMCVEHGAAAGVVKSVDEAIMVIRNHEKKS